MRYSCRDTIERLCLNQTYTHVALLGFWVYLGMQHCYIDISLAQLRTTLGQRLCQRLIRFSKQIEVYLDKYDEFIDWSAGIRAFYFTGVANLERKDRLALGYFNAR